MKTLRTVVAPTVAALAVFAGIPALAQYANEFAPAKLIHQGTTSKPIAGSGKVVVQVEVHPDGSHRAVKVISSTNHGDDDAAMEIAQNSTYRPAHRGSTPITAFYDFTLQFHGKSVATTPSESSESGAVPAGGSLSGAASQVAALIRAKQYSEAKSKAQTELLSSPGDESLRQMLGVAAFDSGDYATAAAAFDKVGTVGQQFKPIAAQSLARAAVDVAASDPAKAMAYAQKAVAIEPNTNSKYALGQAQLASKQYSDAIATLKQVRAAAFADPKTPTNAKVAIDTALMNAYMQTNDTADMQALAAEVKQLDPNSTMPGRVLGSNLLKAGVDAANAKNYDAAFKAFDQAAASGDPEVAVTAYTQEAFLVAKMDKPDYKRMQAYADKALALKPNDAAANFAEGIALTGQWASSHDDGTKKRAAAALDKADQQAKAEGNEALSLQIESFTKKNLNAAPAAQSGSGS
ncbi:MAG: TonB family protein [Candidatus Eremiobacteraeota bacterium]|nr:TonB family protein [Candidatus Eremiobacteraeota bacterium]